jgi:hypothetical protein
MYPTTSQSDEKNTLIWEAIAPTEPAVARRKRARLVKSLVIVSLLFVWWSHYSFPSLLGFGKKGKITVAHDDESQELDFDTVG